MTWTKQKPTRPGWYWFSSMKWKPTIVCVSQGTYELWALFPGYTMMRLGLVEPGTWSSEPISEPIPGEV